VARIVLGITGGIAAYKATAIIRLLTEQGHSVKVIPTQNALRFIGATTLEALSHNSVDPDLYTDVESVKHIALAQEAELVIVAPASASFLARTASGIADDLLSNTILATKAPVLIAPAMHTEMFLNEATQANIKTLESRGLAILEPAIGRLTGEDSGIGRLPEPEQIVEAALGLLEPKDFLGKHVVVTAGGTQEPIDPVRFIANRSSGKQGVALAKAASARGARVTLIGANIAELPGVSFVAVSTALELQSALDAVLSDCDYKTVGFAAETASDVSQLRQLAAHKLMGKGCDLLVANDVSAGRVFGASDNSVLILTKTGIERSISGTKTEVASAVLDILGEI